MVKRKNQPKLPLDIRIKKRVNFLLDKKGLIITVIIIGIFLAAAISFLLPKSYRATSKILFNYNSVNNQYLTNNGSLSNEINYLKSTELADYSVNILAQKGIAVSVNDISQSGEILVDEGGTILTYNFISDEASKAAEIGNTIVTRLYQRCLINGRTPFISILRSIDQREKVLQEDIKRVLSSSVGTEILTLSSANENLISQISEFESELESLELEYQFYTGIGRNQERVLKNRYPTISGNLLIISDVSFNELHLKLDRWEASSILNKVSQKLNNFEINYPWDVTDDLHSSEQTKIEISNSLSKIIENAIISGDTDHRQFLEELVKNIFDIRTKINGIDIAKTVIFNTMNELEASFNLIQFDLIDVARQSRIKKFNSALSSKLKSKIEELRRTESKYFAEVDSIIESNIPNTYFSPDTTLNIILGGFAGLILGIFLAFISNSNKVELIKSAEDIEDAGFNVVSKVPSFPEDSPILFDELKQSDKQKLDPKILDSFHNIETFVKYGNLEKPLKTILVTSQQSGEGKSVISSNIALALANTDNKVLLVDADLKQPELHKLFKIKSTPSLAHYLFRKKELEEIVRNTHNKNLDIITCIEFPQNPSVIVTSERMKNFMTQVEKKYDYVVYDSCSFDLLRETAAIASNIDKVMLVVRSNKTKISSIIESENLLDEFGVSEFNVVLNDVKT